MSNESSQSYDSPTNEAVMARLLELENKTGYRMQQCNGQRKYWNPNWTGSTPPRGSEVFVGKIPRDLFEDELVPVFERVGKIYELRLMMDFSGYNRGYAFVTYNAKEEAIRAIDQLDNYEIRPGMKIGVCRSVDNCRLFVGSIPKDKSQEEIRQAMCEVTEDVNDVIVYPGTNPGEKNRGFAFVEYSSHRAAAMARRKLIPGRITLFGYEVAVDWADPESDVNDDMMNRVKNVYVRNLKATTSEFTIWAAFNNIRPGSIERVKKIEDRDFAFVHFHKREDALYAVQVMNGQVIDGQDVHVSLAKPNAMTKQTLGIKGYGSMQNPPGKFSSGNVSESLFNSGGLMVNRTPMGMNSSQAYNTAMGAPGISALTMGNNDMGPMCTLRGFQSRPRSATPSPQYSIPQRVATPTAQMFGAAQGTFGWKSGVPVAAQRKLQPAVTMDHIAKIKCPVILLNELCIRVNLGCALPQYVLYIDEQPPGGTEQNGRSSATKYVYQVIFAGAMHTPPFSSDTIEEAKRAAAQHVLNRIGPWIKSKLDSCIMRANPAASAQGHAQCATSNGLFSSPPLGKATTDRAEQGGVLENASPFVPSFGSNIPTLSQYQNMGSFLGQGSGSVPMQH